LRETGLKVTGVLSGAEIAQLNDHALQARADTVNLFCRVNPAQKNRIILALKARGRVVGYLGDGINDAPALHSADVSLSVDTAVDVAKEAADLILLKRDLQVLHDGVLEGRRTFANIRKYIMMGTSSSFGNMFSMAAASVFLPFLPMLPAQILLNNVLYDLSEVAIPLDHVDAEEIRRPQAWDMTFIRNFMWVIGPVSSLFDFLTFYVLLAVLNANEGCSRPAGSSSRWRRRCGDLSSFARAEARFRADLTRARSDVACGGARCVDSPFTALGRYFGFQPPPCGVLGNSRRIGGRLPGHRRNREASVLPLSDEQAEMSRSVEGQFGLTREEAWPAWRDGFNELPSAKPRRLWRLPGKVVREPMFLLLIGASTIYLVLGDIREALVFLRRCS
jgi:Mg2+-importing ATPase